jgi:murein L,D-transpeptidase YafK
MRPPSSTSRRYGMAAAITSVAAIIALLAAGFPPSSAEASVPKADRVLVLKKERTMFLMKGEAAFRVYRVALGPNAKGHKERQGDGRTPEGTYLLDSRNPNSNFYRAIHISYPNEADRENARQIGAPPGGNIFIHGLPNGMGDLGADHALWDWTDGCIGVTNEQMDEIWQAVDNGTPIEIRP